LIDDSTRAGFKRRDHHRDHCVQNSITCLCIGPRLNKRSKSVSERLVLRCQVPIPDPHNRCRRRLQRPSRIACIEARERIGRATQPATIADKSAIVIASKGLRSRDTATTVDPRSFGVMDDRSVGSLDHRCLRGPTPIRLDGR
jgi:hypothetical protein